MKRLLFLLLAGVVLVVPRDVRACDVCGCSGGGGYFGILPQFQRHFAGMRWQERILDSYHPASSLESASTSRSTFRTLDLWGRWYPLRRVQVLVFMPVHFFEQNENQVLTKTRGLGDATLLANYSLLNTGDSMTHTWKHSLQMGMGVKLPTGRYRMTDTEGITYNPNLQPGTGSTDVLLNLVYTIRRRALGVQIDAQTRLNTSNAKHYQFGHRQNAAVRCFWWKNLGNNISILPRAGYVLDAAKKDEWYGSLQQQTGGYATYLDLGVDLYFNKLAVGVGYQSPLSYDLGGGMVTPKGNLSVTATWSFGGKKALKMPMSPVFKNVSSVKS